MSKILPVADVVCGFPVLLRAGRGPKLCTAVGKKPPHAHARGARLVLRPLLVSVLLGKSIRSEWRVLGCGSLRGSH